MDINKITYKSYVSIQFKRCFKALEAFKLLIFLLALLSNMLYWEANKNPENQVSFRKRFLLSSI